MNPQTRFGLLLIALLMTAVACSSGAASQPTPTPMPGWIEYEGCGAVLWLPERYTGWTSEHFDLALAYLREQGGTYDQVADNLERNASSICFVAIDSETEVGSFPAMAMVIHGRQGGLSNVPMQALLDSTFSETSPDTQVVSTGVIVRGDREVGRVVMTSDMPSVQMRSVIYLFVEGNHVWEVLYASSQEDFNRHQVTFERSSLTFSTED